ncbi:MAG TPA: hypothetical protein V6D46_00925 [Coleofasciculaceae cyanobacterium]
MADPVLMVVGTILATKAIEKTGEKLTEEMLDAMLPTAKAWLAQQTDAVNDQLRALGDRIVGRLPDAANPFHDPVLLAEIVAEETRDPAVAEVVAAVQQAQLPVIENWKGINVKGGQNTISGNNFQF